MNELNIRPFRLEDFIKTEEDRRAYEEAMIELRDSIEEDLLDWVSKHG